MIYLKKPAEIELMRQAGKKLKQIFDLVEPLIVPGVSTIYLDQFIENSMKPLGLVPSTKGYRGYSHASCISVNEEVVHGVPSASKLIAEGDLVKIDVVASFGGLCVDMARGFIVSSSSAVLTEEKKRLNEVTKESFLAGLVVALPGNFISDISAAIQSYVEKRGFYVVREFAGHGVGRSIHEDPEIPNYVAPARQVKIVAGMTLAIEPMVLLARDRVVIGTDGWTAYTVKGTLASHYEDTVLITKDGCEVLTS